jgi:hypothetical protein
MSPPPCFKKLGYDTSKSSGTSCAPQLGKEKPLKPPRMLHLLISRRRIFSFHISLL